MEQGVLIYADSRDELSTVFGRSRTFCGERKDYLLYCPVESLEIPDKLKCEGKKSLNRPGQALIFPGS